MLCSCRDCPRTYCDDCLDWSSSKLLDETLEEFKGLNYLNDNTCYFIQCGECVARAGSKSVSSPTFDRKVSPDVFDQPTNVSMRDPVGRETFETLLSTFDAAAAPPKRSIKRHFQALELEHPAISLPFRKKVLIDLTKDDNDGAPGKIAVIDLTGEE